MSTPQNFRSAFNGFNREDVVHYIALINNKHAAEINQCNTEIQTLQAELAQLRSICTDSEALRAQLEEAHAAQSALDAENQQLQTQLEQAQSRPQTDNELEAYRRAERAERIATERVTQLYDQANGILADATIRTDEAATQVSQIADGISSQLTQLQIALANSRNALKDTAAAMYAIHPLSPEE